MPVRLTGSRPRPTRPGKARAAVGNLRLVAGRHPQDAALHALVGELSAKSGEFASMWADHRITACTVASRSVSTRRSASSASGCAARKVLARSTSTPPELRWLWSVTEIVPAVPNRTNGHAPTLDEAKARLRDSLTKAKARRA